MQRAASITELNSADSACALAGVDCTNFTITRRAEIDERLATVQNASTIFVLDAFEQDCETFNPFIDCGPDVLTRREQINGMLFGISNTSNNTILVAAEGFCTAAGVECPAC